jgi:hypothetical protein
MPIIEPGVFYDEMAAIRRADWYRRTTGLPGSALITTQTFRNQVQLTQRLRPACSAPPLTSQLTLSGSN